MERKRTPGLVDLAGPDAAQPQSMLEVRAFTTPNSIKVPIALEEMGLDYRLVPVNLRQGEQKTDAFKAMNPNAKVPVLIDRSVPGGGEVILSESGAPRREDRAASSEGWPPTRQGLRATFLPRIRPQPGVPAVVPGRDPGVAATRGKSAGAGGGRSDAGRAQPDSRAPSVRCRRRVQHRGHCAFRLGVASSGDWRDPRQVSVRRSLVQRNFDATDCRHGHRKDRGTRSVVRCNLQFIRHLHNVTWLSP